jgi:hypothetical protein
MQKHVKFRRDKIHVFSALKKKTAVSQLLYVETLWVYKKTDLAEVDDDDDDDDDDALDFWFAHVGFVTVHFEDRISRRDRMA